MEQALEEFTTLANAFAKRMRCNASDLIGAIQGELVDAVRRFDRSKGERFNAYAYPGVVGAMIDFARNERNEHAWSTAARFVRSESLRDEGPEADELRLPRPDDPSPMEQVTARVRSRAESIATRLVLDPPVSGGEDDAIERMHRTRVLGVLRDVLQGLEPDERRLIDLLYREDKTLAEAGAALGLHPRSIQRRHNEVRAKLGARLRAAGLDAGAGRPSQAAARGG